MKSRSPAFLESAQKHKLFLHKEMQLLCPTFRRKNHWDQQSHQSWQLSAHIKHSHQSNAIRLVCNNIYFTVHKQSLIQDHCHDAQLQQNMKTSQPAAEDDYLCLINIPQETIPSFYQHSSALKLGTQFQH